MLDHLSKMADLLDQQGLYDQADRIDQLIARAAQSDAYHMILARILELVPKLSPHQIMDLLAKNTSYQEVVSLMQEMEALAAPSIEPTRVDLPNALTTFDPDAIPPSLEDTAVMDIAPIKPGKKTTHWDDPNTPVPSIPLKYLLKQKDEDWEESEED